MHRLGVQPLGGTELKGLLIAKQVDGAHLGRHAFGNQLRDLIKPRLPGKIACHRIAQPAQQLAALALGWS